MVLENSPALAQCLASLVVTTSPPWVRNVILGNPIGIVIQTEYWLVGLGP